MRISLGVCPGLLLAPIGLSRFGCSDPRKVNYDEFGRPITPPGCDDYVGTTIVDKSGNTYTPKTGPGKITRWEDSGKVHYEDMPDSEYPAFDRKPFSDNGTSDWPDWM